MLMGPPTLPLFGILKRLPPPTAVAAVFPLLLLIFVAKLTILLSTSLALYAVLHLITSSISFSNNSKSSSGLIIFGFNFWAAPEVVCAK